MNQGTKGILVAAFATMLIIGCSHQNNPIDSSATPRRGVPSLAKGKIFDKLDLIAKPPVVELKRQESESKLIYPNKKTDLRSKFYYKSYGKKDVEFDTKLTIEKGSVVVPTVVTLSYDTASGAIVVGPAGLQFLTSAALDVDVKNLDPFADNSTVYFVARLPDGGFETRTNQELTATGNNGKIRMNGAEIVGAGSFVFGSEIELLSIPAIRLITREVIGTKLIEQDKDAKIEAKFQYVSTNGNQVSLNAEMKIRRGSVPAGTTITMWFDHLTGRVNFTPHGLQFQEPALLDVKVENINSFVESGLEFVYVNADGTYEPQIYNSMSVDGSRGRVQMNDAQINHFSQYAFGRRY
jgi:hypothetical protein